MGGLLLFVRKQRGQVLLHEGCNPSVRFLGIRRLVGFIELALRLVDGAEFVVDQ
jgi:hypothetical protein